MEGQRNPRNCQASNMGTTRTIPVLRWEIFPDSTRNRLADCTCEKRAALRTYNFSSAGRRSERQTQLVARMQALVAICPDPFVSIICFF